MKFSGSIFNPCTSLLCVLPGPSRTHCTAPALQTTCLCCVRTPSCSAELSLSQTPKTTLEPSPKDQARVVPPTAPRQRMHKESTFKILAHLSDTKGLAVAGIVLLLCARKCLAQQSPATTQGATHKKNATAYIKQGAEACFEQINGEDERMLMHA